MIDSTNPNTERIRQNVDRHDYRVDAAAVADAIVRRLLEGRALDPPPEPERAPG